MKKVILFSLFSLGFSCFVSAQEQKPAQSTKTSKTEKPVEPSKQTVSGKQLDRNRTTGKAKVQPQVLAKPQN